MLVVSVSDVYVGIHLFAAVHQVTMADLQRQVECAESVIVVVTLTCLDQDLVMMSLVPASDVLTTQKAHFVRGASLDIMVPQ